MIPILEGFNETEVEEFSKQLIDIYHEYFPNSQMLTDLAYRDSVMYLTCHLAKDNSEMYDNRDVIFCLSHIRNATYGDGNPLDLDAPLILYSNISVKATKGVLTQIIPESEVTGDKEEILNAWTKTVRKLYKTISRFNSNGELWASGISKYDINDKL